MISSQGSGKWVFSIFFVIIVVVTWCYPHQIYFVLKFVWDLIVINLRPLLEKILKH